jgi:RNA-directed DNA polymerase
MIEQITTRKNMLRAMYRVQKNKGSSGLDKLPVEDLPELLAIDRENLIDMVLSGKYLPQPILGVQIPKDNGGKRLLGIPTATDRLLQQAVLQVINARFESEFSDNSFGFRAGKSLQKAVLKSQSYINGGFKSIVDIDLKAFFDEVDHKLLLQLVYRKVKCKETMHLIRVKYNRKYTRNIHEKYTTNI